MHRPCPLASGTTGNISSICAPPAYSGNCGPGTFVITTLNRRRLIPFATLAPSACRVGGAKPESATIASAPTDCPDSLCAFIAKLTWDSRTTGSGSPTGRSTR